MRPRFSVACVAMLILGGAVPTSAGTLVVANKSEATVSLVDTRSGEIRATLPTGNAPHEVGVSADGRLALVSNYGTREQPGSSLTLIDVPAAKVVKTIEVGEDSRPHGIAFLDNQRAVVTVEGSGAIVEVNVESGEIVMKISTEAEISHMVAVRPKHGTAVVTNIGSGSISVIDLALGVLLADIPTGEGAEGVALTPDGARAWVTNRAEDTISVINVASLEPVAKIAAGEFPIRAEATADGRFVLVTNAKGDDLSVFDADTMKELGRIKFDAVSKGDEGRLFSDRFGSSSVPIGIEIVDEEKRAYIAHANADDISIVDLTQWKVVGTLGAGKEPDGMGYSPLVVHDELKGGSAQE
jgi:YVTN family beta-propeller protein